MPARRHKFSKCNHFGFGSFCHRCAQADALTAQLDGPKTGRATDMAKETSRINEEITRLRGPMSGKRYRRKKQAPSAEASA